MADIPKIRFKGFTEPWEQRKLGDLADVTKLAGFEFTEHVVYSDEGNIIALRGLNIKNGQLILDDVKYIDGSNFSKLSRSKLFIDDIMFTYVGTVGEVAIIKENDRFYLAPNVSRIRVKSDDSPKFISNYMRTDNFKNKVIFPLIATSSQPALSMENIRKFMINMPKNRDEQDRLAEYFESLDHIITLHQRKCDDTKELKKYMLQKMFPKNGEKFPEIRFKGFTEAWEQRKLGEVFKEYSEKNHMELPALTIIQGGGTVKREESDRNLMYDESNLSNYKMVRKDDFIVHLRSFEGGLEKSLLDGIISPAYHTFHSDVADSRFYYPYFRSHEFIKHKLVPHIYGIRDGRSIDIAGMKTIEIPYTSIEEQRKIGDYLESLDHLITLHQRKCDTLKELKKYMLQNMFPKKG